MSAEKQLHKSLKKASTILSLLTVTLVTGMLLTAGLASGLIDLRSDGPGVKAATVAPEGTGHAPWKAPDVAALSRTPDGNLIRYGRELIEHTSLYLGPRGKVDQISNGMNCQNCHLLGGTKPFGNNYAMVATSYPKFRARSGTVEDFGKRINDCIERSLNGEALDTASRELKAITAYLKWVGKDVTPSQRPYGAGLWEIALLDRPADPEKGVQVYRSKCSRCHGEHGEGLKNISGLEWEYPPLWGPDSYNTGAGLYRLSRFAAFAKANMPYGVSFENMELTDEEAWDVAAYVNSMPRPEKLLTDDWPDISRKPFDHPFGPYTDSFPETQHKYGPFQPILAAQKKNRRPWAAGKH